MDALAAGYTGLRVVGEANFIDVALRDAFNQGTFTGPRLYVCGPSLRITGGHGAHGRRHNIYARMHVEVDGPDAFRAATRHNLKMGADWIKVMITGGIAGGRERLDEPQMTREEMEAVTEAAHAKGVKVCAHCGSANVARLAIEAGIDSIEHGYELDQDTVEFMAERGTYLVPTLIVTQDREMMEKYEWSERGIGKALGGAETHRKSFQMAIEAGVKIASGADWSPINDSMPRELVWMQRCGMTPQQVIRAATLTSAELCGVDDQLGTVEPGKLADLLVVGANPLEDVTNLQDVKMVWKEGQVVANPAGWTAQR
jgi:imidazolonepropionase-like amidohydrolase